MGQKKWRRKLWGSWVVLSRGNAIQGLVKLVRLEGGVTTYTIVIKTWRRLGGLSGC